MSNTFSAKPFVSHDGADEKGIRAEVKVTLGFGNVDTVEPSAAGKAFKVSFAVENTKYQTSGWAPKDSNVLAKIDEAKANGEPIHFRVETRRKPNVDRSLPIAEISSLANAKDNIVKSLAAVRLDSDAEWTLSPQAVTRMDEDPSSGGSYNANQQSPDQLGRPAGGSPAPAPVHGGIEPPPYVTRNRDGELNPGSQAVAAPINLLAFLAEWDRDHNDVVGERKRPTVARVMLSAANELQLAIYEGKLEKPDLSLGSHTRARALVFEVTRAYHPLTEEVVASKEALKVWHDSLVEKSLGIWKWGMAEVENLD